MPDHLRQGEFGNRVSVNPKPVVRGWTRMMSRVRSLIAAGSHQDCAIGVPTHHFVPEFAMTPDPEARPFNKFPRERLSRRSGQHRQDQRPPQRSYLHYASSARSARPATSHFARHGDPCSGLRSYSRVRNPRSSAIESRAPAKRSSSQVVCKYLSH